MASNHRRSENPEEGHLYQIRVRGQLSPGWADWFDGMAISLEDDGDTLICGRVADQSALYGLLRKVRDLGLPLVSVNRIQMHPKDPFQNDR